MSNEREGNVIGALYKLTKGEIGRVGRCLPGDLLVCLLHSGDCHYAYARVTVNSVNAEHAYLYLEELVQGYICAERVAAHWTADDDARYAFLASAGRRYLMVTHDPAMQEERMQAYREKVLAAPVRMSDLGDFRPEWA